MVSIKKEINFIKSSHTSTPKSSISSIVSTVTIAIVFALIGSHFSQFSYSSLIGTTFGKDAGFVRDTICIYLPSSLHHLTQCDQVMDRILMTHQKNGGELPGSSCIFCSIAHGKEASRASHIVYKDDEFTMFEDISPSAKLHYLVVPNSHIGTIKDLKKSDSSMIRRMQHIGNDFLHNNSIPFQDRLFGFHVPPFTSVGHLHMHVLAKPFNSFLRAAKYSEAWGWERWWISTDRLLDSMDVFQGGSEETWKWSWVHSSSRF